VVEDEASVVTTGPQVILVHTGVYRDESLFLDYSATILGAGMSSHSFCRSYDTILGQLSLLPSVGW